MSADELLRPLRDDGTELEATFELALTPVFEITYHHKAGARGSARSVNVDYHEGLEVLLSRLASVNTTILGIAVDSSVAHELPPEQRELGLPFPIEINRYTDIAALRLDITRAQKSVARRPGTQPSGGNDQKRICITVTTGQPMAKEAMCDLLVGRSSLVGRPHQSSAPVRERQQSQRTMEEWCLELLTDGPLHYTELTARMLAAGYPSRGRTPERSISTVLIRRPDLFESLGGGVYALRASDSGES